MTERIDHVSEACKHIQEAREQQAYRGTVDESVQHNATLAVAEATLALVQQQRIANLITLWMGDSALVDDHHFDVMGDEVKEVLGL